MTGPINNHGGLGLNGSKAGSAATAGTDKSTSDDASDHGGQSTKAMTDEVSLSAAGKQLNAQDVTTVARGQAIETPEQAAEVAKQVASAIRQDGAGALSALGSGDVSGLRGLLMTA